MQLKRDLLRVFNSNFINLIIGVINGFLIPAFLSIDEYAHLKTFTLYLSYVGILHFGFIDGIYLKYGGKTEEDIDIKRLKGEHKFMAFFQLVLTVITIVFGLLLKDPILIAFSTAILPINIQTLYKFLYQAIGEFKIYSRIMILTPNLLLFFNLLLIFVFKWNNFWPFVIANILSYYIVFFGLEYYFFKKYKGIPTVVAFPEIKNHFRVGIFIMFGNLASMLFYSSDRWFVKIFLTTSDFAYYSFAISLMSVINVLINTVSMTFYPYLARRQENDKLVLMKKYLLILGTLACGSYFVFDFIVRNFIEKYVPSLDIISILFLGFPAMIIINAIYVNLYKALKQERKYLYTVLKMCSVAITLNVIAILTFKTNFAIALATTLAFYIWFFYSTKDFRVLKPTVGEISYLIVLFVIFYVSTNYMHWLIGMLVFYITMFATTYILYQKDLINMFKELFAWKKTKNA